MWILTGATQIGIPNCHARIAKKRMPSTSETVVGEEMLTRMRERFDTIHLRTIESQAVVWELRGLASEVGQIRIFEAPDVSAHLLREDPNEDFEAPIGDYRIAFPSPVGVEIHNDDGMQSVEVTNDWRYLVAP